MNKIKHQLCQKLINFLWDNNLFTPKYIDALPHMDYLPSEINDHYFYFWNNTTCDGTVCSINTPKLIKLIRQIGKELNLNVSKTLAKDIIAELSPIIQSSLENTIEMINKEESKNNELNYFKHWISRCLLQYWELKYLFPTYEGRNHLLIYDKIKNEKLQDEFNSKNPKLPFGDLNYNDEFLEKKVFCLTEDNMGLLLSKLFKDDNYFLTSRDEVTICYFWLVLILRNNNTIKNFSLSLKEEIIELSLKNNKFKEFAISYHRHATSNNSDKYVREMKVFKNLLELNNFLESDNFYFFAKNVYWKYISPILITDSDIYNKDYQKGESILKDIIHSVTKNYVIKRIRLDEPMINLSDYPNLAFKIDNNELIPINFDALFFEDYYYEKTFNFTDIMKEEIIKNFNDDLGLKDDWIIKAQILEIEKIMGFDFLLIPVNPKNLFVIVKKDIENNLTDLVMNFFANNELSFKEIEELKNSSEPFKVLSFYNALTYILSIDFLLLSSPEYLENTNEFINEEHKFIKNVTQLIKTNKISYKKDEIYSVKNNEYLYVKTTLCDYRIK